MHEYQRQVKIDAPRHRVWDVVADIGGIAAWAPSISESHVIGDQKTGLGAKRFCKHQLMGAIEEEVVAWDEGRLARLAVTKGLPPPAGNVSGTYELEDSSDGATLMSLTIRFDMGWGVLGRMMVPMMGLILRRDLALGLAGLKYFVEEGGPIPASSRKLPMAAVSE